MLSLVWAGLLACSTKPRCTTLDTTGSFDGETCGAARSSPRHTGGRRARHSPHRQHAPHHCVHPSPPPPSPPGRAAPTCSANALVDYLTRPQHAHRAHDGGRGPSPRGSDAPRDLRAPHRSRRDHHSLATPAARTPPHRVHACTHHDLRLRAGSCPTRAATTASRPRPTCARS